MSSEIIFFITRKMVKLWNLDRCLVGSRRFEKSDRVKKTWIRNTAQKTSEILPLNCPGNICEGIEVSVIQNLHIWISGLLNLQFKSMYWIYLSLAKKKKKKCWCKELKAPKK